jgi:uncharacterized protein (TIGR02996 family)
MTEDEAFVRAVVDHPGDDTPRLVYADWLDDRADQRGAYLRTEAELVAADDVGGLRALRLTAINVARLDPVWVARVSRPPIGVCCEHVRFTETGPVLTLDDVDYVERQLGGQFPPDYRAFLLNFNGGKPDPAHLPYPASVGWDDMDLEIGHFYHAGREGLGENRGHDIVDERSFMEELFEAGGDAGPNPLIAGLVPFAVTIHDLGYFLIGIGDTGRGRVHHFRDYCHWSNDPDHLADYAPSFSEFLSRLRQKHNP